MTDAVTVLVPTIGRMRLLEACLRSILANDVQPTEVLVLDQSGSDEVRALCDALTSVTPVRAVFSPGRGIARNMNLGFRECSTQLMLVTHDDCVVAADWVRMGTASLLKSPMALVTGLVLAEGGDRAAVPATSDSATPMDYTGMIVDGRLYPNNMGLYKSAVLEFGGFDERPGFATAAEDLDFCYRWLCEGRPFLVDPAMVVTHQAWRTPKQVSATYRLYARAAGRFYGKHLASGHRRMLRWIARDIVHGLEGWREHLVRRSPMWRDERMWLPIFVPIGVIEGVAETWRIRKGAKR